MAAAVPVPWGVSAPPDHTLLMGVARSFVALFAVRTSVVLFFKLKTSFGASWTVPIWVFEIVSNNVTNPRNVSEFSNLTNFAPPIELLLVPTATVLGQNFKLFNHFSFSFLFAMT